MSIRGQVISGVKWVSLSLVATGILGFASTIVLARLLVPEMFGLVSMSNVAINTIGIIREVGFGAAYVQKQYKCPGEDTLAANTTFFMGCAFNIFLFATCFILTPFIGGFFRSIEFEIVFRIMIFSFIIEIFITVPRLDLHKKLEFGKVAICEIIRGLSASIIAVTLAIFDFGVWSLVFSHLISKLIFGLSLLALSSWRLRFEVSVRIMRELFSYGKYIWAFAIISAIGNQLDKAIIGRYFGASNLGYYTIAFKLCALPTSLISKVLNQVTFPVFSKLQSNRDRLKNALVEALSNVSIIVLPMAMGLVAISASLILTLYGKKWLPAIPIINILAFHGMLLSIASINGPVIKAIGKPHVLFYTSIVHQVILATMLFLLKTHGVQGIAYAVLAPMFVSTSIAFYLIKGYLNARYIDFLSPITKTAYAAFSMYLSVKTVQIILDARYNVPSVIHLILSIMIGILAYLVFLRLLNRTNFHIFKETLFQIVKSKRQVLNDFEGSSPTF